jgi:hypothetical protein
LVTNRRNGLLDCLPGKSYERCREANLPGAPHLLNLGPITSENRFIEIQLAGLKLCEDYTQVFKTALQCAANDTNVVHPHFHENSFARILE